MRALRIGAIIFAVLALLLIICSPAVSAAGAEAGIVAMVEITGSDGAFGYSYDETSGTKATLQEIIDEIDAHNYSFKDDVSSGQGIVIDKPFQCILQGTLSFTAPTEGGSVKIVGRVDCVSLILKSVGCAIYVGRGGETQFIGSRITVKGSETACAAIDVRGTAEIKGYSIITYDEDAALGGYALANSGTTVIGASVLRGHSAVSAEGGTLTVTDGEISANKLGGGSAVGFGIDVQNGTVEIRGGEIKSPIVRRNEYANLTVTGGDIAEIQLLGSQNKLPFLLYGKKIYALNRCVLSVSPTATEVVISGRKDTIGGFRVTEFSTASKKYLGAECTIPMAEFDDVRATESNKYTLTLTEEGAAEPYHTAEYRYSDTVMTEDLPAPIKPGYEVDYIYNKDATDILGDGIYIEDDDVNLTVVTKLCAPELSVSAVKLSEPTVADSTSFVYDGVAREIIAAASLPVAANYTYSWEKTDAREPVPQEGRSVTVRTVPDGGTYLLTVTAEYLGDTSTAKKTVVINIERGEYGEVEHRVLTGVYDPNKKLSHPDYNPDDGYKWDEGVKDTVPYCTNTDGYAAVYNADPTNYNDRPVRIKIDLLKAPSQPVPAYEEVLGYTYFDGITLADCDIGQSGFRWKDGATRASVAVTAYDAYYSPDYDNYEPSPCRVTLRLNRASYGVEKAISGTHKYDGSTLGEYAEANLTGAHYVLLYADGSYTAETVLYSGTYEVPCKYLSQDNNYLDYLFTYVLTVNKADAVCPQEPVSSVRHTYRGVTLGEYELPDDYYWQTPEVKPVCKEGGESYGVLYTTDRENIEGYVLSVKLVLDKADYTDVSVPVLDGIVYSESRRLADIALPEGWSWDEPERRPTVSVGRYGATYLTDEVNFNPYSAELNLAVSKAPSVIVAKARYEILSGGSVTVTGYADNSEQTAILPSFTETAVGVYTVYITTAESDNYLAGSFAVTIVICPVERIISEGLTGSISCPAGVPDDLVIAFSEEPADGHRTSIKITVTLNGENYYSDFTVKIKLTDAMNKIKELVFTRDGEAVEYTLEDGYIVFKTAGSGVYLIDEGKKVFPWWWILVGIAAAGAVIAVIIPWKKGIIKIGKKSRVKGAEMIVTDTENTISATDAADTTAVADTGDTAEQAEPTAEKEIEREELSDEEKD